MRISNISKSKLKRIEFSQHELSVEAFNIYLNSDGDYYQHRDEDTYYVELAGDLIELGTIEDVKEYLINLKGE